jgi:hypothetical protein
VAITNAANLNLTSSSADIAPEAFIDAFPTDLASDKWISFNPVYSNTSQRQWPLTLGSYFYVRTDLNYLNETGTQTPCCIYGMKAPCLAITSGLVVLKDRAAACLLSSLTYRAYCLLAIQTLWSGQYSTATVVVYH